MNRRRFLAAGLFIASLLLLVTAASGGVAAQSLDGGGNVTGEIPFQTNNGLEVTLSGSTEVGFQDIFTDDSTVDLTTGHGNATFSASGAGNATVEVDNITGSTTSIQDIDASSTPITINPEDKQAVTVSGETDHLAFRDATLDDGTVDFSYGGQSGSTTLTITDLPSGETIRAYDTSANEVLDVDTVDSNGELTLTMPNSDHDVELQTTDATPDLSNPTPDGGVNNRNVTVGVDVDHDNFPGTNVSVTLEVNGTQVHSETVNESSTVSTDILVNGGSHTANATATDDEGNTQTLNWTFQTPTDIEIRKENSPSELVTGNEVTLEFYDEEDDTVYTRTTTDGTVDREGLPADTTLVISTEADGYADRQFIIDSLSSQSTIYLLNTTEVNTHEITFTLTDRTGQFPAESTELFIRKPIAVNNTTTYQVIAADTFGVNGYTTILESGQRYRLSVRNEDGDVRVLDRYTPTQDEIVELTVGEFDFNYEGEDNTYKWDAGIETVTVTEGGEEVDRDKITFEYGDPYGQTDELDVDIYERGNESNVLLDETYSNIGNVSYSQTLDENNTGNTWVVEIDGTRDGENVTGRMIVGGNNLSPGIPLDPFWKSVLSVFGLIVLAGIFGGIRAEIGAIVVSLAAGVMYYMAWLPGDISAAMIIVALFVAVLYRLRSVSRMGV